MEEQMDNAAIRANDVVQQIKQMLVKDLELKVVPDEIPDDYSLLEGGLALDSILIAELIARIEDRFGLQFDDRVMQADLLNNLSILAAFVAREYSAAQFKTQGGGAPC
jgi:acyl carrier protein